MAFPLRVDDHCCVSLAPKVAKEWLFPKWGDGAWTQRLMGPLAMWMGARRMRRTEAHPSTPHIPVNNSEEPKDSKIKAEFPDHYEVIFVKTGGWMVFT